MTLLEKLALIRRQVEAVEKQPSKDGDEFTFAPANLVFDVVRDQLRRRKVLALPRRIEEIDGDRRIRVYVQFVDQESDERETVCWLGEAERGSGAATNGFKGALMAAFLIETVEPAEVSRRDARQRRVRRDGIASHDLLRRRIRRPGVERGLYESDLLAMANDMLPAEEQIGSLENLPKRLVDRLHEKIAEQPKVVSKAGAAA